MGETGRWHAPHCPRRENLNAELPCVCIAGQKGLARRSEGMAYTGGDGPRAQARRRRQRAQAAAKQASKELRARESMTNALVEAP